MIVVRPAQSDADRLAVTAVAHAATHPEQPLGHFQALRLAHPRRATAAWWLLEEDGHATCSLVCHPLTFSLGGEILAGYGIGAVSTVPEARKRGHASALCRHAIAQAEAQGRRVGLLYSAIPPSFYERMEFHVLPAWRHVCERPADLAASGPGTHLVPIDPRREGPRLAALYERHHGAALHLHRDLAGWERSLALNPDDLFFGVGSPLLGYVRVCVREACVEITELVVPDELREAVVREVANMASRLPRARLEGWFDPLPSLASHLRDAGRAKTLPMVRGVAADPSARFWATDYF